ncbi:hypothetical protein ACHAXR_012319 [Thalassiosira sp. AJA248-18]
MTSDASSSTSTITSGITTSITNTLLLDINALLNDEDISDITLIPENTNETNDPITAVPAIRAILAARSPVFRRMLYGEFRETAQSNNQEENVEVKLDYSGRVLQLLVEFCFTDKLSSLNVGINNNIGGGGSNSSGIDNITLEEKARLLTNLSGAAHYFDIPKLENDIKVQLDAKMLEHPSLACSILDEASRMLSGEELVLIAMERIRARPKAALLHWNNGVPPSGVGRNGAVSPTFASIAAGTNSNNSARNNKNKWDEMGGVISLAPSLLEQVIFDDQSGGASEFTKFVCLQRWVEGCKHEVTLEDVEIPRKRLDTDEITAARTPQRNSRKQIGSHSETTSAAVSTTNDQLNNPAPSPPPSSKSQNELPSLDSQHEKRLAIAKHLAEKLDLSLIPASDLSTTITESKLIPTHDLYQAYRLQALNAERTKSKVFVEGAGLAEVNGTYIQRGVHEGTPMYNKEGVWRDREEVFRIFLCTYSNGNKSWCLSIVPKGKEPGKTTDLDFYECPVSYGKGGGITSGSYGASTENGLGVVPSRGWKLVNYGQPPVPKCSLIAGCLEDA